MNDAAPAGPADDEGLGGTRSSRVIVLRPQRILFLPIPKSGCTSIKWQLAQLAGMSREHFRSTRSKEPTLALAIHDMELWDDACRWSAYSSTERRAMLAEPGWLRFSVVREPAARLWSAWQSKMLVQEPRFLTQFGEEPWFPHRVGSMTDVVEAFRAFVRALEGDSPPENSHWAPQHDLLEDLDLADLAYLGRAEDPRATYDVLQAHLGPDVELPRDVPRENSTLIRYHPSVYDEASADVVARYYARDFAELGYPVPTGTSGPPDPAWLEHGETMLPAVHQVAERHVRIAELLSMLRGAEWRAARSEQRLERIVARREESLAQQKAQQKAQEKTARRRAAAPATMTQAGLHFVRELAARSTSGSFLEIGPLFGSSTQAIDAGRDRPATIHTIDTFAPAAWVRRLLGIDLSREAFDTYTGHIADLEVHQGFAPDVVRDTWTDPIGFYFDDATHFDPGWTHNFDFFSTFFTDDAILCGDDFAGGWPDIVGNVHAIAEEWGVGLYVIGRVWAITRGDEQRIVEAATATLPELRGAVIESTHAGVERSVPAMCWSAGLHQQAPLTAFCFRGDAVADLTLTTYAADGRETHHAAGTPVDLTGVTAVSVDGLAAVGVQLCLTDGEKTENTKLAKPGRTVGIPAGQTVVAVRFGTA